LRRAYLLLILVLLLMPILSVATWGIPPSAHADRSSSRTEVVAYATGNTKTTQIQTKHEAKLRVLADEIVSPPDGFIVRGETTIK